MPPTKKIQKPPLRIPVEHEEKKPDAEESGSEDSMIATRGTLTRTEVAEIASEMVDGMRINLLTHVEEINLSFNQNMVQMFADLQTQLREDANRRDAQLAAQLLGVQDRLNGLQAQQNRAHREEDDRQSILLSPPDNQFRNQPINFAERQGNFLEARNSTPAATTAASVVPPQIQLPSDARNIQRGRDSSFWRIENDADGLMQAAL